MSTPAEYVDGGDDLARTYDDLVSQETGARPDYDRNSQPTPQIPVANPTATSEPAEDLAGVYDGLVAEDLAESKRRRDVVQGVASKYTPEAYAEATKLAAEFGIDAKTVADNPEPYRKESKRRATEGTLKDAPATREWLTNLNNAAVAQDDIENLAQLERGMDQVSALTRVADVGRAIPGGVAQALGSGVSGLGRLYSAAERKWAELVDSGLRTIGAGAAADFLRQPTVLDKIVPYTNPGVLLSGSGSEIEAGARFIAPPVERQNIVTEVAGALGQIAGQVGTALATGPGTALAMLFGQGADIQGDRAEAAGASQADTDLAVAWGAAITGITEKYQLDQLLKVVPTGVRMSIVERVKRAAIAGLGEGVQEITEGIGQNIAAKSIYEPDAAILDLEQIKREGTVAGSAGAIAKFLIDAIVPGKSRSNARPDAEVDAELSSIIALGKRSGAVERGEAAGELSAELVRLVGQAQLTERAPEQLESLAVALKEKTGIEYAYVDAAAFRTLFQSDDEANAAANEFNGGQSTYYEAALAGAPIAVPIEKYISRIAPRAGEAKVEGKQFSDFVAFEPEGLNANEASTQRDELMEDAKKAAEREAVEGTADTSQAIYDDNLEQLLATGMEKRTAEFNATLTRAAFRTLASRAGMDPLQLYQRYQLKVRGQFEADAAAGATELTQGAIESPEFKQWFGESKVVDADGAPLVVYHGTPKGGFTQFDKGRGSGNLNPKLGDGFYFSPDKAYAEHYAREADSGEVLSVYVTVKNPLNVSSANEFRKVVFDERSRGSNYEQEQKAALKDSEIVQSLGYDGIVYRHAGKVVEVVAFRPEQIKSATGNRGSFDPTSDNILFQDESTLPFYSALTRAAEGVTTNKASAAQWMATLRKTAGVKPEEIEWSGIEEWLGSLKRSATKDEVVEYLKANQLVIEEVEAGSIPKSRVASIATTLDHAAASFGDSLRENDYFLVNDEPGIVRDRFTSDGTIIDEDGNSDDLYLDVEVHRVRTRDGGVWAGVTGGHVTATVTFPDGRSVDAIARFDFDDEDGAISELRGDLQGKWKQEGEFSEAELAAVENALTQIELESNRSLSKGAQRAIDNVESDLASAAESLREGEINDAIRRLQNAESTAHDYGEGEFIGEIIAELKGAATKYEEWTTPGGDNYKELLLTLPPDEGAMGRERRKGREQLHLLTAQLNEIAAERAEVRAQYADVVGDPPEKVERLTALRMREIDLRAQQETIGLQSRMRGDVFKSSHWDEKNIVAHVRFNERTDADGKRVLFVEEIQSDWHQAGRRKGYQTPKPPHVPVDKLPDGWTAELDGGAVHLRHNGQLIETRRATSELDQSVEQFQAAAYERAVEMYNDFQSEPKTGAVADAPFKTSWAELAFKRMIRYAADNGFERIAWTPGKLQAERYDLSKQVDVIHVHRQTDGQFAFNAKRDNQDRDLASGVAKDVDALADQIGKELADKAATLEPGKGEEFRGADLRVGGAGMVGFYDKILPNAVNKLVKKWGAKVGRSTVPASDEWRGKVGEAMDREPVRIGKENGWLIDAQSIDITPAMREAALAGLPMFQRGPTIEAEGKRGSITFGADRKFTINLFEKRDLSTYLHESGHLYLEMLGDLAADTNAPQQIKDDYATLLKWFGVKDRASIGVEQHEQFARGFEAYLAEGKAPSVELQPVFFRFRQWMMAVYKAIRNLGSTPGSIGAALNVSLTDEVRAVMDRMVATDEQIAEAENAQQYAPIFTTAEDAGMTAAEWSAYREIVDKAHRESVDELTTRAMAELTRERTRWWKEERKKVLAEVTAEANASPVYRAIAFLTKGKNPDGSALAEGTPTFKLSRADVVSRFGEDAYKALPRGSTTTAPEGITAETAAQLLGFPSGADMVRALTAAPPKKKAIEQVTDARMHEQHGAMMADGSMVEQAIDSVHTEARAKVLAAELRALSRKRKEVKPFVDGARKSDKQASDQAREANAASLPTRDELKTIRQAAQQAIAAKKIRTITPQLYRAAERKAAKRAFELAGKGKFEDAYLAKRQQILNFELYRAAVAARTQIDKQVDYMRRFDKTSVREKLAKAKGQYLAQIDALRARFDFTQQPRDADLKRDALTKFVDEQIAAGREVTIPQWVIDEARTTPYKELTAAELEGLVDAAKNIEHLAKTKDRLLRNRAKAQFEQAKVELEARARDALKGGKAPPVSQFEESLAKQFGRGAVGFFDSLVRPETLIEWLDGGTSGPWHDFFMEPANNAEYARETLRTKILEPMRQLANNINRQRRKELNEDIRIESLGQSFDRRTLISIALNMGNASNLERLLEGGFRDITNRNRIRKFTPQSLIEIKSKLNAKDWQFVQELWNTAESLWPEMKAFQERMGGLVPEKIPAVPIETPFGTFTGGYWPAVYDSLASKAGTKQADSADALGILMGANFSGVSTGKSALQERTGSGGPLKLDFSAVMGRHLDQVITDITHREFAIQAMRILDDGDLKLTLQDTIGEVGWQSLRGMVAATIQQDSGFADLATKDIDTVRRRLIGNLAVAALGFKFMTGVGNYVLAPMQAGARVKPQYLLKGIAKFMRHPLQTRAFVDASSEMMRNRAQNMDASFTVIREKLEGRTNILAKTQRAAMSIHQAADYLGTTGIWMGSYQQARDAGSDHDEAVRLADKAIRTTQTAGAPKDLSAFERNPAYRELKLFIGPMIIMGNRMREAVQFKGTVKRWPEMFGVLLATWFLPAIMWDIVNGRGPDDDDDDDEVLGDEFLPWALRKVVAYPFMTVPYLREVAAFVDRKLSGQYAEARMTPASDAALLVYKAGSEAVKQLGEDDTDDDDDARKLTKAGLQAVGPLIGLPTNQLDITGSFLWDVFSGEYEPEGAADLRYLVMRRPKDE